MESIWNDMKSMWKVMDSIVESYGIHCGIIWNPLWNHMESMWNDVESMWNDVDSIVE